LSETERAKLAAKLLTPLDEARTQTLKRCGAGEFTKRAENVARGEAQLVAWDDVDAEATLIGTP
jgi:hypothetical protein